MLKPRMRVILIVMVLSSVGTALATIWSLIDTKIWMINASIWTVGLAAMVVGHLIDPPKPPVDKF